MSLNTAGKIVDEYNKSCDANLLIMVGEPLRRKDIFDIIERIGKWDMQPQVVTNGTLTDSEIEVF